MKAISLYQPNAWLVAVGEKRIVTRDWQTEHRGAVAIHASILAPPQSRDMLQNPIFQKVARAHRGALLARGAMIAYAELADVQRLHSRDDVRFILERYGAKHEADFGNFAIGGYAWILKSVARLAHEIQAPQGMGIWDWNGPEHPVFIDPAPRILLQ